MSRLQNAFLLTERDVSIFQGWVPKSELSTQEVDYPEKLFYVGQVVTAVVVYLNIDTQRLRLSFIVSFATFFNTTDYILTGIMTFVAARRSNWVWSQLQI